MILFMKNTILFKIENFLLIIFCIKSKVSNKKVLDDSGHMVHKIKKLLYSININLQQVWWTDLVEKLIFFKKLSQSQPYHFFNKKKFEKNSFQWPGSRFHTLEAVPKGYYDPQVTWQHIAKSPSWATMKNFAL